MIWDCKMTDENKFIEDGQPILCGKCHGERLTNVKIGDFIVFSMRCLDCYPIQKYEEWMHDFKEQ